MNHMPLLEHLKVLKAAMPNAQKQEQQANHKLPIYKNLKTIKKPSEFNQGIFQGLSFCVPFVDPENDPSPDKINEMVRGIFMQGGIIIEYHQKMNESTVKFLIVSQLSNLQYIRSKMVGLVKYEKILRYEFVLDSLKRLKKMDPSSYLLLDNSLHLHEALDSASLAKEKLMAEKINEKLIRPPLPVEEKTQQSKEGQNSLNRFKSQASKQKQIEKTQGLLLSANPQPKIQEGKKQLTSSISPFQREAVRDRVKPQRQKKEPQVKTDEVDQFPWQNKADRRVIWYEPPKNLASHSFAKNNLICEKFMQLQDIYKRNGDIRNFSYIRAVAMIKNHDKEIRTVEDIKEIKGLSTAMTDKIKELLQTGHITKLNAYTKKQENVVCKELQKVWGIGPKKAKQFYDQGIKTVGDLRKRSDLITSKNMAIGLKYFQQFSRRIPREKVTRIFTYLKKAFIELVHSDRMHHLQIVGSYRRERPTCGDIDLLICRHDNSVEAYLLRNFVQDLESKGFITESLSQPRVFDGHNNSAYMGVCLFEGEHHRIDIKHYPVEQYAFALMYFTGSDLFNRQIRMKAHNRGLLLSDHGLKKKQRNGMNKIWKGGEIPTLTINKQIVFTSELIIEYMFEKKQGQGQKDRDYQYYDAGAQRRTPLVVVPKDNDFDPQFPAMFYRKGKYVTLQQAQKQSRLEYYSKTLYDLCIQQRRDDYVNCYKQKVAIFRTIVNSINSSTT